ncbi:MAG: class I SAM-dependent methyltransferase [Caldilineaceae bacterium]
MSSWNDRRARKARLLLRPAMTATLGGRWADIGCGDGVFTRLLVEWLAPGSTVVAVDRDQGALRRLVQALPAQARTAVQPLRADFTQPLSLPDPAPLDGLLLANSLHFVRQKEPVLTQLVGLLRPGGAVIIIEYNADRGNGAVPYPLRDERCLALMRATGLHEAYIVTREPSSFLGEIYTAMAVKDTTAD